MKKIALLVFCFFLFYAKGDKVLAQSPNLVLNPSFENHDTCRNGSYPYYAFPPWHPPNTSANWYFNTCSHNSASGAPQSNIGFQQPRTGNAYMGIYAYVNDTFYEYKAYTMGTLSSPLNQNKIYCVSFYVALENPIVNNATLMAISQLGAYISSDSFFVANEFTLPFAPQVESPAGVYLTDSLNWTEISGTFIAQGGEKYITIGNYHLPADTTLIQTYPPNPTQRTAFYFIDDVSVTECGSVLPAQTACGSYTWYGQTYTTSGTYTQIVPNFYGGDSTLMLNLTILNNAGTTLTQTACNSFTYDGNTFTSSGTYVQHNQNSAGCDSTFTLYLTITNDVNAVINATACNSYTLNTISYQTSGTYIQSLLASNGCDSVLTLYLTIDSSNASVTITDPTLTAQSIGTYQWLNCSTVFTPLLNETNQSYTATANGDYAVIITNGACVDTSACYTIYTVGLNQIGSNEELIITPNPATNQFTIENSQLRINAIHIYNVLFEEVLFKQLTTSNQQLSIDVSTWKAGVYFVEVETEKGFIRKKLVKE